MIRSTLKRAIVVVMLIATLVCALVAGVVRADMGRSTRPATGASHGTYHMTMYCPPPPILCSIGSLNG